MVNKKSYIISIIITFIVLYLTFRDISFTEIVNAFSDVKYIYIIPSLMLCFLTFYLRAIRWKYLIQPLKEVPSNKLISSVFIGYMGNILPARAGELIRSYIIGKKFGIGFSSSLATVVVERVFDVLMLLTLIAWMLLFRSHIFASIKVFNGRSLEGLVIKFGWGALFGFVGILFFCYLLIHSYEKIESITKIVTSPLPEKWRSKVIDIVYSFKSGLVILKNGYCLFMVFILSIVIWFFVILSYYPFFLAFNFINLPFSAIIVLVVMTTVLITALPTPGFLGSYQYGCVLALHTLYKLSEPVAASFGILAWLSSMGFIIIVGIYCVFLENISLSQINTTDIK